MLQLKDKLQEEYNKYKEFDNLVRKNNEYLKNKDGIFKDVVSSLENDAEIEKLQNLYKDSLIYNSQLRMSFEHLMYLIAICHEMGMEIAEEIKKFYDDSLPYKSKSVFFVEHGEIKPIDQEVLDKARSQFNNSPIFKAVDDAIKQQNSSL